jgi:hypothetical protein
MQAVFISEFTELRLAGLMAEAMQLAKQQL